ERVGGKVMPGVLDHGLGVPLPDSISRHGKRFGYRKGVDTAKAEIYLTDPTQGRTVDVGGVVGRPLIAREAVVIVTEGASNRRCRVSSLLNLGEVASGVQSEVDDSLSGLRDGHCRRQDNGRRGAIGSTYVDFRQSIFIDRAGVVPYPAVAVLH